MRNLRARKLCVTFSATYALHNYFNFDKRAVFVDYLTPIQASNERVYPIISIPRVFLFYWKVLIWRKVLFTE